MELIYPGKRAPLAKGAKISKASEMLPIIDISGLVLEQAPRSFCHSPRKPLHPVIHLHIIDREGRIYLQKRSASKHLFPQRWDTAVGGHVSYGEHRLEALYREASEELGLYDFNPHFLEAYVFESPREKELVNVFAAVGDFALTPDRDEVECGRFWTSEEIGTAYGKEIFTPNFESELLRIKDSLEALL